MSPSVKPFNEAKYKALMDGLECSEIRFNEIHNWNPIFRIDAEFYNKRAITIDTQIRKMSHLCLNKEDVVSGPFGSTLKSASYLSEGPVPFIRIENIKGGFYVNTLNIMYISEEDNNRIKNSALRLDDIVLSKVGNSIGYFARIDKRIPYCNISENNIGIKLEKYQESFKHYLVAYLNCSLAQKLVARRTSGNAQPKLNVGDMCLIPIPTFSDAFYKVISNLIINSENLIAASQEKYRYAEKMLVSTIDMVDRSSTKIITSLKSLSESFLTSGRLDAEYYQPKYDELFTSLKKHTTQLLGGKDGIVIIKKSIEPGSDSYCDEGIPFVRVSDVTKYGISEPSIRLPCNIVAEPNKLYPKKNTILFSKDGSVGIAYKVEKDTEVITSGALLHLTVKKPLEILPDYLTLVLNSSIVQLQAERDSNGAIIQHWKPSEIENVIIPILDIETQQEIASKVQESFALRHQSEQLLENAKQAVELAIEQGEDKAMKWLKGKNAEV